MKPIALQLYSLREQAKADWVGVLKLVADIGYVGVETAGTYGAAPKEFRKVLNDLGLVCCATHGRLPDKENFGQRLDEATALGTKLVISGLGAKDFATPESTAAGLERLAAADELARSAGLKFGYHNHWWEFEPVPGGPARPYEQVLAKAPGMFSELDIYWAAAFGTVDVPAVIRQHAARIPLLHVKDGPLAKGQPHTAAGAGKMDIPACVAASDDAVLQWLIVELDQCATDMATAVRESYQYLVGKGLAKGRK